MATIGIDLSPLQSAHRMRGIGATAMNVLRNIPEDAAKHHSFVFYMYESGREEVLNSINIDRFKNYSIRTIEKEIVDYPSIKSAKGLLAIPNRLVDYVESRYYGTRKITDIADIDVYLQFEQDIIPPRGIASTIIAYDLIPYILESDYLWSYSTARHKHNYSRRGAFLTHMRRRRYISTLRDVTKRASKIIAISEQTKTDFEKFVGVDPKKISVCHLGVSPVDEKSSPKKPAAIARYLGTAWGDVKLDSTLPNAPFLLFAGGLDPRRKVTDLISAFNQLRGRGYDINLIMVGDTMFGPNSVPNAAVKDALLQSSYLGDIYMLGFVDETTRDWLYENALAFVYPTKYEGFGLPVLEAMRYGTPVITSGGSSVEEISGGLTYPATGANGIVAHSIILLESKKSNTLHVRNDRANHALSFKWTLTSDKIITSLIEDSL